MTQDALVLLGNNFLTQRTRQFLKERLLVSRQMLGNGNIDDDELIAPTDVRATPAAIQFGHTQATHAEHPPRLRAG